MPTPEAHELYESVRETFEVAGRVERRAEEIRRRLRGELLHHCLLACRVRRWVAVVNPISALEFVAAGLVMRALPDLDAPYVTTLVHRHDVHLTGFVRRFLQVVQDVRDRELGRAAELCGNTARNQDLSQD